MRWRWVSLSGHKPRWSVICISVTFVVARDNVQENPVLHVRTQIWKTASDSGKHSPAKKGKKKICERTILLSHCNKLFSDYVFMKMAKNVPVYPHDTTWHNNSWKWSGKVIICLPIQLHVAIDNGWAPVRCLTTPADVLKQFYIKRSSLDFGADCKFLSFLFAIENTRQFMNEANQGFIYICVKLSTPPQLLASTSKHKDVREREKER
jgi:hypothetical protein